MREPGLYNIDCMEVLKEYPDNYFDLCIADPPYGAGFTEGGGYKGWFSKYHQNGESSTSPENVGGGYGTTGSAVGSTGTRHYAFGIRKCRKSYQDRRNMGGEIRKKLLRGI